MVDLVNLTGPNHVDRKCRLDNIEKDYGDLLESKILSDVILVVGDTKESQKEFQVHKAILGARSPVFAAMFQHDMKEKKQSHVLITDIDANAFESMLGFIYKGTTPLLGDQATELLFASDKVWVSSYTLTLTIILFIFLVWTRPAEVYMRRVALFQWLEN